MAIPMFTAKAAQVSQLSTIRIEVPRELIECLAYQNFLERGGTHGEDLADWFAAECELGDLFGSVSWAIEEVQTPPCLTLQAIGPTNALSQLCRYFRRLPTATAEVGNRIARFSVLWPDMPEQRTEGRSSTLSEASVGDCAVRIAAISETVVMGPIEEPNPTEEQVTRAENARSPVVGLSDDEFAQLKGNLVALLLDGADKGTVIAYAPLDFDNPAEARRSIKRQVAGSDYKDRRYQLRQILADAANE